MDRGRDSDNTIRLCKNQMRKRRLPKQGGDSSPLIYKGRPSNYLFRLRMIMRENRVSVLNRDLEAVILLVLAIYTCLPSESDTFFTRRSPTPAAND
ncbi:hypothetical protein V6N11_084139 [Hibiscus sabdariffa]|uniref:Uncharacterized protein n=1 Tax=Hibiscus sabdariffa TaxID=183260 RepID=A0ABR1ZBD3_9ROSI